MRHKVSELEGPLLDAAVALAEGHPPEALHFLDYHARPSARDTLWVGGASDDITRCPYSSNWSLAGPLIERERISVGHALACWYANIGGRGEDYAGPAPLIAAMRAYVASKFGDEVELP